MKLNSDSTSRLGVHIVASTFEALGFAFREQPTSDFGIDAQVEVRAGSRGTGELLALQIKSGDSYFREATADGWCLRTDAVHANYWLEHSLPVIIVQVDVEQQRVFWQAVNRNTVHFGDGSAKIFVKADSQLDINSVASLLDLVLPIHGLLAATKEGNRVFLGRGVSDRKGWKYFAARLAQEMVKAALPKPWTVLVEVRTDEENNQVTDTNEYGADGDDLVLFETDTGRRFAKYSVSSSEVSRMDGVTAHEARITAEGLAEFLMEAEGLFDHDLD